MRPDHGTDFSFGVFTPTFSLNWQTAQPEAGALTLFDIADDDVRNIGEKFATGDCFSAVHVFFDGLQNRGRIIVKPLFLLGEMQPEIAADFVLKMAFIKG